MRDAIAWLPRTVLCEDGKTRTARVKHYFDGSSWVAGADTWFSVPARVKAFGKTVSGFVGMRETESGASEWYFVAYKYRANWSVISAR